MKNILIPTDFSENSLNAIRYAVNLYKDAVCNFYILHVEAEIDNSESNLNNHSTVINVKKTSINRFLKDIVNQAKKEFTKNKKHHFFTIANNDSLINAIREQVLLKSIDLIVMGTKGVSGCTERTVGTNAGNVITKVKCNTLIVPENAKYVVPKKIAFPTDFSINYNIDTLQPITQLINEYKSEIELLHISKKDLVLNESQQRNIEYLEDYFAETEHSFHFLTHKKMENAIEEFVISKQVGLITMLAKNLNYFQHILFHPLAKEISYYKNIPFLVLH
ncbi:universal stress protein [Neotamlana laminarinivorans]|uniref:Universal stress protein n=1 Tax=Neotamlana laminarinivorans TaxID=2883124 RepID=A0A9X1I021_9FLAO|nr:universal stress protein [Tamlana laminarinivorans]MCB4798711.1 universal stress protein [Tamlana laminarinivorans]